MLVTNWPADGLIWQSGLSDVFVQLKCTSWFLHSNEVMHGSKDKTWLCSCQRDIWPANQPPQVHKFQKQETSMLEATPAWSWTRESGRRLATEIRFEHAAWKIKLITSFVQMFPEQLHGLMLAKDATSNLAMSAAMHFDKMLHLVEKTSNSGHVHPGPANI